MDVRVLFLLAVFSFCVLMADCTKRNGEGTKKPANRLVRPLVFNPKNEWDNFVKQAERNEKRDREIRNKILRSAKMVRGPKGPRGPQGPPGAVITKREMMREFRKLMKELVENRIQIGRVDESTECIGEDCNKTTKFNKKNHAPLFAVGKIRIIPKIVQSFTWELSKTITIESRTIKELSGFQKSSTMGSNRCLIQIDAETTEYMDACNNNATSNNGRYTVNRTGVYTFFVSLHIHKDSTCVKNHNDRISVILCIDLLCDENMSLKAISSLEEAVFTETLAGFLYLKLQNILQIKFKIESKNIKGITGNLNM